MTSVKPDFDQSLNNTGKPIHLVLGGRRSGKSAFAEKLTLQYSESPVYLATSRIWDDDHKSRVQSHINNRTHHWTTIEKDVDIDKLREVTGKTVLLEDLSLWLTNIYFDCKEEPGITFKKATDILNRFIDMPERLVIVSGEVGLGVHPETKSGRDFADLLGRLNQELAAKSETVDLVVAGIPVRIKQ
jgi:adenosylcobinamide kinase / adenosylcobinamide-phosphate guanylyltransferase